MDLVIEGANLRQFNGNIDGILGWGRRGKRQVGKKQGGNKKEAKGKVAKWKGGRVRSNC